MEDLGFVPDTHEDIGFAPDVQTPSDAATPTPQGAARAQRNMYAKNVAAGKTDMWMTPEGKIVSAGSGLGPQLVSTGMGMADTMTMGLSHLAESGLERAYAATGLADPDKLKALGYSAYQTGNPGSYMTGQIAGAFVPKGLPNRTFQALGPAAPVTGILNKARAYIPAGAVTGGVQGAVEGAAQAVDQGGSAGDVATQALKQGASGTALGGVTAGVLGTFMPSSDRVLAAKQQADRIDEAAKAGIPLSPADATQSPMISQIQKILTMVPFASGVMNKFGQAQGQALQKNVQALLEHVGLRNNLLEAGNPKALEQVGVKIQDQVNTLMDQLGARTEEQRGAMRDYLLSEFGSPETYEALAQKGQQASQTWQTAKAEAASQSYDAANEVAQGQKFKTPQVQALARQWLDKVNKLEPGFRIHPEVAAKLQSLATSGNPQYEQELQKVLSQIKLGPGQQINPIIQKQIETDLANKFPPGRTISQLNEYATGLRQGAWDQYGSLDGEILKTLRNSLDGDLQDISDKTGGQLQEHLDNALSLTRERKIVEDSQSRILNGAPDQALAGLVAPNKAQAIKQAVNAFGSDAKDSIAGTMGNKILGAGADIPLTRLSGYIRTQANRYGQETVDAALGNGSFQKLHDAADKLDAMDLQGGLQNKFIKQAVQGALEKSPEDVAGRFVQPNNTQNALFVARSLGEDSRKAVGLAFIQSKLKANGITAPSDITSLSKTYGEPTLRSWLGDDVMNEWNKINKISASMGAAEKYAANSSGTGQILVGSYYMKHLLNHLKVTVLGSGAAMATGHPLAAGTIAGGGVASAALPYAFAKLYTNPRNVRMLRQYLETAVTNPQSPNLGKLQVGLTQALRENMTTPSTQSE